jgi:hypothetical protein
MTVLALGFIPACVGTVRADQDRATPPEVIERVQQAVQDLAKSGEAGLATFSRKNATGRRAISSARTRSFNPHRPNLEPTLVVTLRPRVAA